MKINKKTLVAVIALVACLVAIVGGTLAYFVDTTAVTFDAQGENLDLELSYYDGADWVALDNETEKNAVELTDSFAKYEPGYTRIVHLKVRNAGSVALKYKLDAYIENTLGINIDAGEPYQLSDHLKAVAIPTNADEFSGINRETVWGYEGNTEYLTATYNGIYTSSPTVDPTAGEEENSFVVNLPMNDETEFVLYPENNAEDASSEQYITVAIWMPTEVSNEANYKTATAEDLKANPDPYQHRAAITMDLKFNATQYTFEADSQDSQYDAEASLNESADGSTDSGEGGSTNEDDYITSEE